MGPTTKLASDSVVAMVPTKPDLQRQRRGSLPELKTAEKKEAEKKVPTGPRANPLYKTRLCMNFQSTGSCPYTDKCQFAHGVKELEKWENWRAVHNKLSGADPKKETPEAPQSRSRSQSMERTSSVRSMSLGSHHETPVSPAQSLNWDLLSPARFGMHECDEHLSPTFSLYFLDEDSETPVKSSSEARSRSATVDSTYDNISQLRDAPTLFPSPPVLSSLSPFSISH